MTLQSWGKKKQKHASRMASATANSDTVRNICIVAAD